MPGRDGKRVEKESRRSSRFWGSRIDAEPTVGVTSSSGGRRSGSDWRRTATRRKALQEQAKQALKERMHEPVPETGKWLGRVLNGFYQYHAVPGNWASLDRFRERVSRYWRQVLEKGAANGAG